jgi:hypothetical protein
MGMEGYGEAASRSGGSASDSFTLAKHVLEPEEELVATFQKLVNREILLSNIGEDKFMQLEQTQVFNLGFMLSMAVREPELCGPVFKLAYYGWKGALALTRAKGGKERDLMASVTGYTGGVNQQGFMLPDQEAENVEHNLFAGLTNLRKKKQKPEG